MFLFLTIEFWSWLRFFGALEMDSPKPGRETIRSITLAWEASRSSTRPRPDSRLRVPRRSRMPTLSLSRPATASTKPEAYSTTSLPAAATAVSLASPKWHKTSRHRTSTPNNWSLILPGKGYRRMRRWPSRERTPSASRTARLSRPDSTRSTPRSPKILHWIWRMPPSWRLNAHPQAMWLKQTQRCRLIASRPTLWTTSTTFSCWSSVACWLRTRRCTRVPRLPGWSWTMWWMAPLGERSLPRRWWRWADSTCSPVHRERSGSRAVWWTEIMQAK